MKNSAAFHAALHTLDSIKQTYGCRYTNPDICAHHSMPGKCAFVCSDNICRIPPISWPKQFAKLQMEGVTHPKKRNVMAGKV
jgi:hypothetical protein